MRKLLVPVDGSLESRKAVEKAVTIAKKFGSEVTLISVVEVESEVAYTELGIVISSEYASIRDTLTQIKEESMNKMLDKIIEGIDCTGLKVGKILRIGSAPQEIIDTAESGKYDLIVMGHRGMNPVKRFFLGSVAKRVLEGAPCSVLIVKP